MMGLQLDYTPKDIWSLPLGDIIEDALYRAADLDMRHLSVELVEKPDGDYRLILRGPRKDEKLRDAIKELLAATEELSAEDFTQLWTLHRYLARQMGWVRPLSNQASRYERALAAVRVELQNV